jgi:hypothetical protein
MPNEIAPKTEPKTIQCTCLGKIGRFGNQMFQYAAAKKYAQLTKSILQVPKWVGQELFEGLDDPLPSRELPKTNLDEFPPTLTDIDLNGWYRYHDAMKYWTYRDLKSTFKFKQKWLDRFPVPKEKRVVAHLRRTDITKINMSVVDISCYYKAIAKHGFDIDSVKFVSDSIPTKTDSYSFASELRDLDLEWLPDFMEMVNAKTLFRSNSTFSWWAAALGDAEVYSPIVDERVGIQYTTPFVRGNFPKTMPIKFNIGKLSDIFLEDDQSL